MQEEIVHAREMVRRHRSTLDELWVELETANTWEHINQIAGELSEAGLAYKHWKRELANLTGDSIPASM